MARPRGICIPKKCAGCSQIHYSHDKKYCLKRNQECVDALKECRGKENDFDCRGHGPASSGELRKLCQEMKLSEFQISKIDELFQMATVQAFDRGKAWTKIIQEERKK